MPMRNKIKPLLAQLGVTAYKFAQDTGITKNTVYSLSKNECQFPTADILDRIISTYGVPIDAIIEWVPDTQKKKQKKSS